MENLLFISRHEPLAAQLEIAKKLGYTSIKKIDVNFSDDPIADLKKVGVEHPCKIAGVFPLQTAIKLLTAGFELVVFTNSKDARDASKFVCTGADVMSLSLKVKDFSTLERAIYFTSKHIACELNSVEQSELYAGARAI